ncbi:hypothetical protein WJX74_003175 [Apatococcus lobatus]|uniref:SH3 domain-containing protein n=1 Tax=Apatococcus lobatus TaxID=904363 RepID=A0AAW1Q667_9CHLO
MRNPSLAKVVTHLQHASLVLPWAARIAAAQALAKVAVRSEEPYRMQCYAILTALVAADGAASHDTIGVASVVEPALRILDSLYATRITMDNLQTAYGDDPEKWPSRVIASLRVRNDHLVQQIEQHICVLPPHSYCPIGTFGKELLAGGRGYESPESPKKAAKEEAVVEKKAELAALQAAKSPFAAAEAQAHPGELSTDEEEAGSPSFANAPLGGEDELEKLTQQLDDQITKDAWRPKVTVQQPTFGQETTEAAKDDFDKFVQRAADSDGDESVYSDDLGRQESGLARAPSMAGASRRGFMLHTFEAEGADELSVEQNEQVTVLGDEMDGWFNVVSAGGDQGIVPSSYVQILDSFEPGYHRRRSSEAREPPAPVYDPFAEPDRLSELLKGPEPVATFSGHRRSTSRGSDGTGDYYGTTPTAATPRTPRTPLRRAPSRQMSLPGEDPYTSAFARASSLEPAGYDGLGPSRGSMGYGYDQQEPIPEDDDYVASYPAPQQPAFTSAFAAASGLPSQASFEGDIAEEEHRFGAAAGLRPARMHSRTVSFADEEIPPPANFGSQLGDSRVRRYDQHPVERLDNGGPATAYREEYIQEEMPQREEFNREEFFGNRALAGEAVLTGDNVSPTVREEFNREEFFGQQGGPMTEVTTTTTQVLVGDNSNAGVREEFNREEFFGRRETPQDDLSGGRLPEEAFERDPYAVITAPSGLAPVNARKHSFSSQRSMDVYHPAHRQTPSDASMISVDVPSSAAPTPGQPTPRTALFPFIGEMDDELTINKGEAFIVHSEADGWLEVTRLSDNRSGLVPVGYIQ